MYIPSKLRTAAESAANSAHETIDEEVKRLSLGRLASGRSQDATDSSTWPQSLKRQFSDNASKNADIRTGIIVGVVLGVALIGFIVFLWIYRFSIERMARRKKRKRRPRSGSSSKSSKSSKSSDAGAPPPPGPPAGG